MHRPLNIYLNVSKKMSNQYPRSHQQRNFAFDGDYRTGSSNVPESVSSGPRGLVSFFQDDPVDTTNRPSSRTQWSATAAPEEDLREGMDDYARPNPAEETSEDLRDLIASMPHNVAAKKSSKNS